ncbi:hypothetical protein CR513_03984, partial [Mucuna pruriens]
MIDKGKILCDLYVLDVVAHDHNSTTLNNFIIFYFPMPYYGMLGLVIVKQMCPLAKLRHSSFISHNNLSKNPLDLVQCDVWGSYPTIAYDGRLLDIATFLINKIPSPLLHNHSLCELLFKHQLDYSNLRVFGYLCFASTLLKQRNLVREPHL